MTKSSDSDQVSVSRRKLFGTATTLGAVAAVVSIMPSVQGTDVSTAEAKPAPTRGGGYVLSEHIKRYYQTTLV